MKKKIISIVLALMLGISLFAFAACSGAQGPQGEQGPAGAGCECAPVDLAPILARLDNVESQLVALQSSNNGGNHAQYIAELFLEIGRLEGLISGIPSTDHTAEIASIQSTLTGLRNDLTALQNSLFPTPENSRIHQLGETFYYRSHGMVLFSIEVRHDSSLLHNTRITITSINLFNANAINAFVVGRTIVSNTVVSIPFTGASLNASSYWSGSSGTGSLGNYIWFFSSSDVLRPIAIFKVS